MKSIFFSIFFFFSACSSVQTKEYRKLSLETILNLKLGQDDQDQILNSFGPPYKAIPSNHNSLSWVYLDDSKKVQKVTFNFNDRKKLQNIVWITADDGPEKNLEFSKNLFPKAEFKPKNASSKGLHYIPSEIFYSDEKKGITLVYQPTTKNVEYINLSLVGLDSDRAPALKQNP